MDNTTDQPSTSKKSHFKAKQDRGHVKHFILEKYLQAWVPKMTQGKWRRTGQKILYIDGFSGTGEFEKSGEDGSPAVALKAVLGHSHGGNFVVNIHMVFIELNQKSAEALEKKLEQVQFEFKTTAERKNKITFKVIKKKFVDEMNSLLQDPEFIDAPIFLFADPFGYNGKVMPMRLLNQILSRQSSEVFVNVMDGSANRAFTLGTHEDSINQLVGSDKWIDAVRQEGLTPAERIQRFITVYKDGLQAEHKLHFGMRSKAKNRHIYNLVFASNHFAGLEAMKMAMTNASQDIESLFYSEFCSFRMPQIDTKSEGYKTLCAQKTLKLLWSKFSDKLINGHEVAYFILKKTPYVFNFRIKLGKLLKVTEISPNSKFDQRVFRLSEISATKMIQIETEWLQLKDPILQVKKQSRSPGPKKPNAEQKMGSLKRKTPSSPDVPEPSRFTEGSAFDTPVKHQHPEGSTSTGVTPAMGLLKMQGQERALREQQTHVVRNLSNEMGHQLDKVDEIVLDESSSQDENSDV